MKEELPTRLLILGSTAVFLVLGVIGVSTSRDIAARYCNIQIPVAWYLFPIVLAVLVAASALLLPAAVLRWRRAWWCGIVPCHTTVWQHESVALHHL